MGGDDIPRHSFFAMLQGIGSINQCSLQIGIPIGTAAVQLFNEFDSLPGIRSKMEIDGNYLDIKTTQA